MTTPTPPGSAGPSNREIATLLRDVALALKIRGADRFQSAAYDAAASGVAHASVPVVELWRAGRLRDIAGVGATIAGHLDEWLRTGQSTRLREALAGIPDVILELVRIPGVGPATAQKLAAAGVEDLNDLQRRLDDGRLGAAGIGAKLVEKIGQGLAELTRRPDRLLLPSAVAAAAPLVSFLRAAAAVERVEVAGSIRRRCATVADIDLVVAAGDAAAVLAYLRGFSGIESITAPAPPAGMVAGRSGAVAVTITLQSGRRVDVMIGPPEQYGALLLWSTGSIAHNEALTRRAETRGYTLGPDGLCDAAGQLIPALEEIDLYATLGLPLLPPELREWPEVITAAERDALPRLVRWEDIRGDCHTHTTWSDGRDNAMRMIEAARALRREYLVITDHSYPNLNYAERAVEIIQLQKAYPDIRLVNGLEVNITVEGGLQVPDEVLAAHQFCLASIHTGFRQPPEVITSRLLAALAHPSINGIAHPTGRLLLRREGIEADWEAVFDACLRHDKFLEIDGPADRLDLPDELVREAVRRGVKLVIDSDAHATEELHNLRGGIDVARRGWVEPAHVLNTRAYADFAREARVRG